MSPNTGDTIGMQRSDNGYVPVAGHLPRQLARMSTFYRLEIPDFTVYEYAPLIDSSDMTLDDWEAIARNISANYDRYDGFVILHGTDTMTFTACELSFILENLDKLVIVTGSKIPLEALRSDEQTNLLNALYLAAHYPVKEVGLFFNNKLLRGNRTTKAHADRFDAFASPNLPPLLEAGIRIRRLTPHGMRGRWPAYRASHNAPACRSGHHLPGISAAVVGNFLRKPVRALILRSYGVGNAAAEPGTISRT